MPKWKICMKRVVLYDSKSGWERWKSKRCGALGIKLGMRCEVDVWGNMHGVTLLQLQNNEVLRVKGPEAHQKASDSGYTTLQIGAGLKKWKNLSRAEQGQFAALGVDPKARVEEFVVSPNAVLKPGTPILATHFVAGQFIDIRAITKGKGTAGVMERHGMAGGNASHGNSKSHRSAGSIASGSTSPSRVFKGTPMAGRMGHKFRTVMNLQVIKINTVDQILTVKGSIPGPKGTWVRIMDAVRAPHRLPPPYPTHLPEEQKTSLAKSKKYLRLRYHDPYKKARTYDWETRWNEARIALKSAQQAAGGLLEGEEGGEDEGEDFSFEK